MFRQEAEAFFGAVRFFTRLPVPAWVGHSQEALDRAARYFPLVGILVGALGGLTFLLAALVLPVSIALLFSMAATLLVTGAFHEDGLADAVDGFGGGWTREQVLAIMKDSRIGSYGALAVALMLLAKFNALYELPDEWIAPALVAAHAASRFCSTALIYALGYVRDDDSSRAKPLAVRLGSGSLAVAGLFGLAPLALLPWEAALAGLALAALTTFLAARYFVKRIGGYTGDCLGAAQQLAELAIYLGILIAAWNFS
ncbi:MAG: adenosylcobinamide-GDP ribazoletransferase [Rhodocyclaceae bacterium]|nr:adenosylcobinamide-GDP ribazoletransferase [Rhodocyclaceae bacterium]